MNSDIVSSLLQLSYQAATLLFLPYKLKYTNLYIPYNR